MTSPACIKGVRDNFGNATISFDEFHAVIQVTEAVKSVRGQEVRQDPIAREQLEKTCRL
jgi:transposase